MRTDPTYNMQISKYIRKAQLLYILPKLYIDEFIIKYFSALNRKWEYFICDYTN